MRILLVPILLVFVVGCGVQHIEFIHYATEQPPQTTAMFDWSEIGGVYHIQRIEAGQSDTILGLDDHCNQRVRDREHIKAYGRTRLEPGDYEYYYDFSYYRGSQRFSAEANHAYVVREESDFDWWAPRGSYAVHTTKIWVIDQDTGHPVSTINTHYAPAYGYGSPWICAPHLEKHFTEEEAARRELRAKQGDREMAFILATEYQNPDYIRPLAEQGDTEAAIVLAKQYGVLGPLRKLAEQDDAKAAYEVWLQHSEFERLDEGWYWLCKAANWGNPRALAEIGYWHRSAIWTDLNNQPSRHEARYGTDPRRLLEENGVRSDDIRAYMWYTLAGEHDSRYLQNRDDVFANRLTKDEIAEAEQMADNWQPDDCTGAKRRFSVD